MFNNIKRALRENRTYRRVIYTQSIYYFCFKIPFIIFCLYLLARLAGSRMIYLFVGALIALALGIPIQFFRLWYFDRCLYDKSKLKSDTKNYSRNFLLRRNTELQAYGFIAGNKELVKSGIRDDYFALFVEIGLFIALLIGSFYIYNSGRFFEVMEMTYPGLFTIAFIGIFLSFVVSICFKLIFIGFWKERLREI